MYTEKVKTMRYDVKGIPVQSTSAYLPSQPRLSQGWALKQKKPKSAFTAAQKIYEGHFRQWEKIRPEN